MSLRRRIRAARVIACALTAAALAAPAADARPAQDPMIGATSAVEPEPATPAGTVPARGDGSEWDSVAIGAGGATLVIVLAGTGTVALSRRHRDIGTTR